MTPVAAHDELAVSYVCDRIARLYEPDRTGELLTAVRLEDRNALRFILWNHRQCYGRSATPACN